MGLRSNRLPQRFGNPFKGSLRLGIDSYWPEAQVEDMTPNYDYSEDEPQESFNSVPFVEVKGVF